MRKTDGPIPIAARQLQRWLAPLLGMILLVILSGCASTSPRGSADTMEYNPATGYPWVGCRPWVSQ